MSSDDRVAEYTQEGRKKTKWDKLIDFLDRFKWFILIGIAGTIVAGHFGYLKLPEFGLVEWFWTLCAFTGISIGASAVLYELEDYLKDRRVQVSIAPVQSGMHDVVRIPRKTFGEFDVIGTRFPDRRLLDGSKILVARAIDFDEQIIVPAQEFDDGKYPDDLDLIGEDADGQQIEKYRNALLQDARERHEITVDKEVIRESAMGDAVDLFADALKDVRDGDIELEQMDDQQVEVQAEQLIQAAAQQNPDNGGDDDE